MVGHPTRPESVWTEPILHVDMDAFFVEVERLRGRAPVGVPVAVGGRGTRAVVAAASYEARPYGVRSALPMARAMRLCPDLVVVPPDHDEYRRVSESVFEVFRSFTPRVEGLSLDEAFLDVAGLSRHYGGPVDVAGAIRTAIREGLGLPASVGVAGSKFVAKLASEAAKPDGIRHIALADQAVFLDRLPVRALWGVGEATMAALEGIGVETVGDVAALPPGTLERRLGTAHGRHLAALASGHDPREVEPDVEAKSVSVEHTYDRDLRGAEAVDVELLAHSHRLASRLRRSGLVARTITLKIRYADFTTITRAETRRQGTAIARDIHHHARRLATELELDRPVRLVGLGASALETADAPRQLSVDDDGSWSAVSDAVESVRRRFGDASVGPARLLEPSRSRGEKR